MNDYIKISSLNDFIFCPYSIYLHNVYEGTDKDIYHAFPQVRGSLAHQSIDQKSSSTKKTILLALPVYSDKYHLMGKIDCYDMRSKYLIERKYQIKRLYKGQIYQLWAQYFCMKEMGYDVERLAIYEISTHKTISIPPPSQNEIVEFEQLLDTFMQYDPSAPIDISPYKCNHCIYSSLCDKTENENVYS